MLREGKNFFDLLFKSPWGTPWYDTIWTMAGYPLVPSITFQICYYNEGKEE
jgi:hypothetical protein